MSAEAWLGAITRLARAARYRKQRHDDAIGDAIRSIDIDAMPSLHMAACKPWPCECILWYLPGGLAMVTPCGDHKIGHGCWQAWERELTP